ncbi:hypothetical protein [uncultured Mediterranean phage uvMED]|nr:hypothetical protein [uncultured Mediterranean phage uvMED]
MGGVISRPKPPAPPPAAPVVVAPTKPEIDQGAVSKTDMARGKGRSSTILTGAKGLGDNKLTTSKRTLLGG